MANITLTSIRESIERQYVTSTLEIDEDIVVKLRNPMRLPDEDRKAMLEAHKVMGSDDSEDDSEDDTNASIARSIDAVQKVLLLAVDPLDRADLKRFLDSLVGSGDRLLILMEIVGAYMSEQQVGEASPSES